MISMFWLRLCFVCSLTLLLVQCGEEEQLKLGEILCDAEKLSDEETKFISYGNEFGGGIGRSDNEAYKGSYSCALDSSLMYGMTHTFKDLKPLEVFNISVYRKENKSVGSIVAQSLDGSVYAAEKFSFQKKDLNGWDLLSLRVQLPSDVSKIKGLKVYVFNGGEKEQVYFDNLRVHRYLKKKTNQVVKESSVNIEMTDLDYSLLQKYRDEALREKVISKRLKKEFEGFLKYKGKTYKIGIRLKGDWTDHLVGDKWSYRIKVKDGQTIMGFKSFSIQSPMIRDYLQEWVVHEACEREGILTTSFDYVPVSINGIDFGLYNVEEHFEKQLVESRKRREGPILKFSEDGFWESNLYQKEHGKRPGKPFYESAIISCFNSKKVRKSAKLNGQFLIAQNLMLKYKNGDADLENIINVEQYAKTHALMDLGNVYHSFAWHNQRFYYNPVTSRLELIVYDCYSGPGNARHRDVGVYGNFSSGVHIKEPSHYGRISAFDDPSFQKQYLKYLRKYSSKKYVNNLIESLKSDIDSLSQKIKEDDSFYVYDYDFLVSNAAKIRAELSDYESKVKSKAIKFALREGIENECSSVDPFKNISLNAYLQEVKPGGSVVLSLQNYHCKPISVVGYSSKQYPDSVIKLSRGLVVGNFPEDKKTYKLSIKEKPKRLFFRAEGSEKDTLYRSKITPWPIPTRDLSFVGLKIPLNKDSKIYEMKGDSVIFKKGKHLVKESLVIPVGKTVVFEAGAELVLNNKKFFLSYSAVTMNGNSFAPIKISSTDGSGAGFTILNAEKESLIEWVVFEGLNTYSNSGWNLTGAVTFYESDVKIDSCVFTKNKCEDGLNIIRSSFSLSNSKINFTYSDGFDADFCEGIVSNCIFEQTGNDCLDFSGSKVEIKDCRLNSSGDKGVSCGEQSQVKIDNLFIDGAVLGLASKDNSVVKVANIHLKNCETGFSAFQKKSEYGPGSIFVDGYEIEEVDVFSDIEEGSRLELKNKIETEWSLNSKNKTGNSKELDHYIKKIKGDKKWMESIRKKAKERNVSIEEMIETDAKYTLKKNS